MIKRILSPLLAVLIVFAGTVSGFAEEMIEMEKPTLTNVNMAALYEETTDTWMYLKNENVTNAPASMTKIMTATLVLDFDHELSGTTTVSANAISEKYCYWLDDEHLEEGEVCKVDDLMHYLLIVSGNEAATTLAEYVAGDIDTFVGMMNERAQALGMTSTVFYDPHGLSDDARTTCSDMIKLCRFAMNNYPKLVEITSTRSGEMPVSNKRNQPLTYRNTNRVLRPDGNPHYETGFEDDIIGIKTGSTTVAGVNLSCCMVHDDLKFYSVAMHGKKAVDENGVEYAGHHADTASLMRWARSFKKLGVAKGDVVATLATSGSKLQNVSAKAAKSVWILAQEDVEPTIELYDLGVSVSAGDVVGKLTYSDEFGNVRSTDLVAADGASSVTTFIPVICLTLIATFISFRLTRRKMAKDHTRI